MCWRVRDFVFKVAWRAFRLKVDIGFFARVWGFRFLGISFWLLYSICKCLKCVTSLGLEDLGFIGRVFRYFS